MMSVDATIREFSVFGHLVSNVTGILLLGALATTVTAATWLGMRVYLRWYGVLTEGTVNEAFVQSSNVRSGEFSASSRMDSHYLKIQYDGADGVKHIINGKRYASVLDAKERASLQVGGKVPVYYVKAWPSIAVYYDPAWHYTVPAASLVAALIFLSMAASGFKDTLRFSDAAIRAQLTREQSDACQIAIWESSVAIDSDESNAAAYERRGDAEFSLAELDKAIADYSKASRLQPHRLALIRKRAKAEWFDGRPGAAMLDWLKIF